VGDHEPPPHLRDALSRPNVRFVGHVERAADEFQAADALLVPTPIRLGARVRILTAFSHGCPVVAHDANALGIPELVDGDNVLLGTTAAELADAAVRLLADESLRRTLARRGRETYERFFAPPVAAAAIEERLRAIAAPGEHVASTTGRSQVVG
jgi:O-antigen biosynthesis protein